MQLKNAAKRFVDFFEAEGVGFEEDEGPWPPWSVEGIIPAFSICIHNTEFLFDSGHKLLGVVDCECGRFSEKKQKAP